MPQNGMVRKLKWVPFPRTEKGEACNNPYCGLYSIFRFYAERNHIHEDGLKLEEIVIDSSHRLCLVEINLIHFNAKPLSQEALYHIKQIFRYFSMRGKQMIVRFVYDWEGKGIITEPKDMEYIIQHMEQLSSILKDYARYIYILQGLFIGSWGEMHNSRYLSDRQMTRLAKQLYECSGESTQIALRCPSYWRMVFKTEHPLDDETAFSELWKARFALFNDGMLASETDYGTYGSINAKESKSYSDKWNRQDELDFQHKLCKYVSNGGEVINVCEYNDVIPAIEDLRKMRVSYLHCQYDEQVLNKWKASKSGSSNPVWRDKSAFDYIVAHLGYRFKLEDVKLSIISEQRSKIRLNVKLCNVGFAPCYHKFEVRIAIRNVSYSELYEYEVNTDTRFWVPNMPVELECVISTEKWKKNKYTACLGIYDPRTQQVIEIVNTFSAADHEGYYALGGVSI